MIREKTLEERQEQYIMRSYSEEIQLEIDDVYGCPGHCPGCALSSLERKSFEPDMKFEIIEKSIEKLTDYIITLKNLKKLNLTYGIADHFLMSNEYLAKTYHLGADLIEKTGLKNEYNGVFFTASMIGKHDIIMDKIKALHAESLKRNVPVYVIAVLDPKQLLHKKFAEIYKKNIVEANKLLKKVDLSINLSEEAIDKISPKELYDFALMNNFDEVTINWTPTHDNMEFVYFDQRKLANWLIEFDNLISVDDKLATSYRPVMIKTINNLMCSSSDIYEDTLKETLGMQLKETLSKSLQIDDKGNLFPKYEAIGDIAHTPRLGIKPWGNVTEDKSINEMLETGLVQAEKFITKQFLSEPCMSCKYSKFCANSGFHIYNYVIKGNKTLRDRVQENLLNNDCFHSGKILFKHYFDMLEKEDKLR